MYTLYAVALPLGIKTGDFRSGPPPVGRIVVFFAVRVFTGTDGYKRRAGGIKHGRKVKNRSVSYSLSSRSGGSSSSADLPCLCARLFRSAGRVLAVVFAWREGGEQEESYIPFALVQFSFIQMKTYNVQERRQAVVSLPAARMLTI